MFLMSINVNGLVFTTSFCVYFILAFYVIQSTNFESIFKQGKIWAIRLGMIFLSIIIAYLLAQATLALFTNFIVQ